MMRILLFTLLLALSGCRGWLPFEANEQSVSPESRDALLNAFNSPECTNPCWLGIEVGVTDKESVLAVLQEYNVEFTLEGYTGDSIWLRHIPDGLVPGMDPERYPLGVGTIHTRADDGSVQLIDFALDLCVSTVVATYGAPKVWRGATGTLVYLNRQLFFSIDEVTRRVYGVILHTGDAMPSSTEFEDWSEYVDAFSEDCEDALTGYGD